jgi:hypothetical protein
MLLIQELLDAIRIDDTTAFEELISRYWFCIYQYSYGKTRSEETAAEIPGTSLLNYGNTVSIFLQIFHCRFICMKRVEKK